MAAHDTGQKMDDLIRTWTMVVLTLIFVGLYIAALAGWPGGLNAGQLERLTRIEQIVFVIIGYYFGRLPGQQNEKTLKEEVNRQAQKADQAQDEKEQAQRSSDTLQEKVKNVKAALATTVPGAADADLSVNLSAAKGTVDEPALRQSVAAALRILDS